MEPQPRQVHERGCSTKFNGLDGEHGKSASLWLADMERHRETGSSPSMYFQHIDRHLEGEAARWVLKTPTVRVLIYKGYMELATESDIEAFHRALTQRFKLNAEDLREFALLPPNHILFLKQRASEQIEQYYVRTRDLLLALHGRDGDNSALTPQERSLRAIVVAAFAGGLSCRKLCHRLWQQQILHPTRTLHQAYQMAEAEIKTMDSERETEEKNMKEQERKRKLPEDGEEADTVIKQKRIVVKLRLTNRATTPDDEARSNSDSRSPGVESPRRQVKKNRA